MTAAQTEKTAHASVVTAFGEPAVLEWQAVPVPQPGAGQIRVRVRAAGVGPTDLRVRSGELGRVFGLTPPFVLGYEAAGTVDALGSGVTDVTVGEDVAVLLRTQGGYAEYVVADTWVRKPANVSWDAAAALPASANAALGVLQQLDLRSGESLLLYGGAGSVGIIAIQLAVDLGAKVFAVARPAHAELIRSLGATFVPADQPLADAVHAVTDTIDAVMDAAGTGGLEAAIELAGGTQRVITLSDASGGAALGVTLSAPTPDRAPDALAVTMPMLADGRLQLKERTTVPLTDAASAHAAMEAPGPHPKYVLTVD
jgi:NADPH:quinone reductase-like Zn-dependent oxidoreductase